jgi:protein-disulfide isomerase
VLKWRFLVSKKTWIIFVAICVVVLGGLVYASRKDKVEVGNVDQYSTVAASAANGNIADHVFGKADSKVVLVEYGDFQCPACGSAYPNLKDVTEEFKDKIAFIFRNNPLTTIHPNARAGAAAAEAAGLQDKYWEMHDMLYERQNEWSAADATQRKSFFESYATQVGIKNMDKFRTDMASKAVNDKIDYDLALGKKVPVTGTPTILLDGKKVESDVWSDAKKLKAAVEDALK